MNADLGCGQRREGGGGEGGGGSLNTKVVCVKAFQVCVVGRYTPTL